MNFIRNRIDHPPDPPPVPQIYRHIDLRLKSSRTASRSLNETHAGNEPYVICTIAEGRGYANLEIGVAAIDISAPVLQMSQFSDNFWYSNILTSLEAFQPHVIYFSDHSLNTRASNLPTMIRNQLPNVQISGVPRAFFNDRCAERYMSNYCSSSYDTIKDAIRCKYYGLSAVGALLRICFENNILQVAAKALQFMYLAKIDTLMIDGECVGHLELIRSLQDKDGKNSLFNFLNHCITGVGKRHLRANLLEPCCRRDLLESRLNTIDELIGRSDLLQGIQRILRQLVDIGGLTKLAIDVDKLNTTKQNTIHVLNQAVTLKNALAFIPELNDLFQTVSSSILQDMKQSFSNERYQELREKITSVIGSDSEGVQQTSDYSRLFLVKQKVSTALDILRGLYSEVIDEIREYVATLTQTHRLPFKMSSRKSWGFYIQVTINEGNSAFPSLFKVLNRSGSRFSLSTSWLQACNERINGITREIELVSYGVIRQLMDNIREDIEMVYVLVAHITNLDVLQSLAVVSQEKDFCRPKFGRCTKIVGARHPLLELYGEGVKVVKNNIISTPEYNVFIVTGPNMSGKTVYIKTICLLQIMAQMGCYVPALRAEFRIADRLMAIFGAAENIEQDVSHSTRMSRKLEAIAQSVTVNSLVVIDEIFSDTQHPDSSGPRWKLLENLVNFVGFPENEACQSLSAVSRPFIYLTTHCHNMLRPLQHLNNVSQLCLQTETRTVDGVDRLHYKYTVSEGRTSVRNYGIALARGLQIPDSVIKRAEEINEQLKAQENGNVTGRFRNNTTTMEGSFSTQSNMRHFNKRLYDLYAQIACVLSDSSIANSPNTIQSHLNTVLQEFVGQLPADVVQYLNDTSLDTLLQESLEGLPRNTFIMTSLSQFVSGTMNSSSKNESSQGQTIHLSDDGDDDEDII
ncbi:mutS protein homolog 4-like [Uranotaenia lowii]|uniref:mutS protein homolog 4-like n=1 Tax=Uranotaenia lowii TaxID=190385 RepID=UPI0024789943|nr:mutS protein homolog 4-like [Uranotaenia lowii]